MSKYTTEVRYIVETYNQKTESQDRDKIEEMIDAVSSEIIGEYPIFDEKYRKVLNNKIIRHYYTREIGFETVGLWRFKLNTKMKEIMPYFNQLYESELLHFDPFLDFHYTKEGSKNGEVESTRQNNGVENISKTTENSAKTEGNSIKADAQYSDDENESERSQISANSNRTESSGNAVDITANTDATAGSSEGHSNSLGEHQNESTNGYSDTPQGSLVNVDSGEYLTNGGKTVNIGSDTGSNNSASTSENESQNTSVKTANDAGTTESNSENSTNETQRDKRGTNINGSSTEYAHNTADTTINENNAKVKHENDSENITNFNSYIEHLSGKRSFVSYSKMLLEFRDTFLNIDMMIINSLEDLFMGVW